MYENYIHYLKIRNKQEFVTTYIFSYENFLKNNNTFFIQTNTYTDKHDPILKPSFAWGTKVFRFCYTQLVAISQNLCYKTETRPRVMLTSYHGGNN